MAMLNAQILLGKKRCMNYTALFMALHLELVFSPLCMCSIAVPKISMVSNTKLVELGILKPGNTPFFEQQSLQRKCGILCILCYVFILQNVKIVIACAFAESIICVNFIKIKMS